MPSARHAGRDDRVRAQGRDHQHHLDVLRPVELDLRTELAVKGLRAAPPVRRRAGAGPSDDGHFTLGCSAATLPLAPESPFALDASGRLTRDGVVVEDAMVEPIERPRFYDLTTADGVPYEQLARLHGSNVLATTVVQTCIRYTHEDTRCRFCTIEESLKAGATTQVKLPEQLAEVAEAAVRLDGVEQMVMTTGTSNGPDRGAKHLAKCVRAIRERVPYLPIQVQIEPPLDLVVDRPAARRRAPTRSASTSSRSTRRCARAGRPARRPCRSRATRRRGGTPSPSSAPTASRRTCSSASARIPTSSSPAPAGSIDMGVYPFVVPVPPARGLARARRRRAGAGRRDARRRHPPRGGAAEASPACAAPTRSRAAPRAAPARRCRRPADERRARHASRGCGASVRRAGRRAPRPRRARRPRARGVHRPRRAATTRACSPATTALRRRAFVEQQGLFAGHDLDAPRRRRRDRRPRRRRPRRRGRRRRPPAPAPRAPGPRLVERQPARLQRAARRAPRRRRRRARAQRLRGRPRARRAALRRAGPGAPRALLRKLGWERTGATDDRRAAARRDALADPALRPARRPRRSSRSAGCSTRCCRATAGAATTARPSPARTSSRAPTRSCPSMVEHDPEWAGWCAMLVNAHDLSAMGATPVAALDALGARDAAHAERVLARPARRRRARSTCRSSAATRSSASRRR